MNLSFSHSPIAILGAGSWGTALSLYLARRNQTVRLWSYHISEVATMLAERTNNRYLPGFPFPDLIQPTANLVDAIKGTSDILIAVPSSGFRETLIILEPLLNHAVRLICATKGLDAETGQLLNEVTKEILGTQHHFAVLSGPSFAREVAAELPTAVMIACHDTPSLEALKTRFDSPLFRIHTSQDVVGVELGGAIKNVVAIATGIIDGLSLGANARSTLITLGFAEMLRLGKAMGGDVATFMGLSGMGDLILTATDNQSRNRRLGLALGKGQTLQEAEHDIGQIIEGKRNAELIAILAKRHDIDLPICQTVWQILQGTVTVQEGLDQMLSLSS